MSGRRVIEELNGLDPVTPDATTRQYTWGLDLAAQAGAVNSLEQAGGIGGLLAAYDTAGTSTTADDRTFLYFYDANGNVGQVVETTTGSAGTIVAHYEYTPYGQVLVEPDLYDQPYRFSTKPFDSWTGLGYWGYRHYSPGMGRWVNRDPIGETGGVNLYWYVANRSVIANDALGLEMYEDPRMWVCCQSRTTVPMVHRPRGQKTYLNRSRQWGDAMKACTCSGCGSLLVNAHWGKCCWCTVKVLRLREGVLPFYIGKIWSYGGHEKLVVDCDGRENDLEADALGRAQWGWDNLGISVVAVGLPPKRDPDYFTYQSTEVDCACASRLAAKIRAEASGGFFYVTGINDCRDYARMWFDTLRRECFTR